MSTKELDSILDCQDGPTALLSIAEAFRCSPESLGNLLRSIDLEAIYDARWRELPRSDDYLLQEVTAKFGEPILPKKVAWFHLTRTKYGNQFKDGILPLGEVLPRIWEVLIELAPDESVKSNLAAMRENGVRSFHFKLKAPDPIHWGPYAILVRDVAFHSAKLCQHDYLGMPEIIEDICNGHLAQYGRSIIEFYEQNLRPCIVKFEAPCSYTAGCLKVALCYARTYLRSGLPKLDAVICYDGESTPIPPASILSIEYVNAPSQC